MQSWKNVAFSTFAVIYEGGKAIRFSGKIPKGATVLPNDRVSLGHSRQSRTLVGSLTKKTLPNQKTTAT